MSPSEKEPRPSYEFPAYAASTLCGAVALGAFVACAVGAGGDWLPGIGIALAVICVVGIGVTNVRVAGDLRERRAVQRDEELKQLLVAEIHRRDEEFGATVQDLARRIYIVQTVVEDRGRELNTSLGMARRWLERLADALRDHDKEAHEAVEQLVAALRQVGERQKEHRGPGRRRGTRAPRQRPDTVDQEAAWLNEAVELGKELGREEERRQGRSDS